MDLPFPVAQSAYVVHPTRGAVTVVDRGGSSSFAVKVAAGGPSSPRALAVDAAHAAGFLGLVDEPGRAPGRGPGALARVRLGRLAVERVVRLEGRPRDVVLTSDGGHVLVVVEASAGDADVLHVFGATTLDPLATAPLCADARDLELGPDRRVAIATCHASDELVLLDVSVTPPVPSRVPLGGRPPDAARWGPSAVRIVDGGHLAAVSASDARALVWFSLDERRALPDAATPLGAAPGAADVLPDGALLVPFADPDGIARVRPRRVDVEHAVRFPEAVCRAPRAARVAQDGRAYVLCAGNDRTPGSLVEVNPSTLAVRRRWATGVHASSVALGAPFVAGL